MPRLSEFEVGMYWSNGYAVPNYRVPEETMNRLELALEETLRANPNVRPEQLAAVHTPQADANDTKGHATFLDVALDIDLVELVSGVIGDNIIMWRAQLFCKPGSGRMEVPMHQDGQYWPIRPHATFTLWLAIDLSDTKNGCLQVITGSHNKKIHYQHRTERRDYLVLNQSIEGVRVSSASIHYIELERGQLSLHDVFLVQGSSPNRSCRRRAGYAIRYMPTISVMRRDIEIPFAGYPVNWKERPLWLAKGKDISGNNDLEVGHLNKTYL